MKLPAKTRRELNARARLQKMGNREKKCLTRGYWCGIISERLLGLLASTGIRGAEKGPF